MTKAVVRENNGLHHRQRCRQPHMNHYCTEIMSCIDLPCPCLHGIVRIKGCNRGQARSFLASAHKPNDLRTHFLAARQLEISYKNPLVESPLACLTSYKGGFVINDPCTNCPRYDSMFPGYVWLFCFKNSDEVTWRCSILARMWRARLLSTTTAVEGRPGINTLWENRTEMASTGVYRWTME